MLTITKKAALRKRLKAISATGQTIGLVPTMGNLHAGHLKLIDSAKRNSDFVVCTVFINPLQFGPDEDLSVYPRTLDEDTRKLAAARCDCLFAPSVKELYGSNIQHQTTVHVPELTGMLCGKSRPGHFDGVATVVNKLFNLVRPDTAFFGLKDYQQLLVIRKMNVDLGLGVEVFGIETQRESSGLALSSRNNALSAEQRERASLIYQCLVDTADQIKLGKKNFTDLEQSATLCLQEAGIETDYFSVCEAGNLQAATERSTELVILAAAQVGSSRLIDNIRLDLDD